MEEYSSGMAINESGCSTVVRELCTPCIHQEAGHRLRPMSGDWCLFLIASVISSIRSSLTCLKARLTISKSDDEDRQDYRTYDKEDIDKKSTQHDLADGHPANRQTSRQKEESK